MTVTMSAFSFAALGLLFVGLSIPLMRGRIPPNRFYGFRTPKTLSDPKIWYEINRVQGNDLFVAGAVIVISSVVMFLLGQHWKPEYVALTLFTIMVFSLVGALWHGFRVLSRM